MLENDSTRVSFEFWDGVLVRGLANVTRSAFQHRCLPLLKLLFLSLLSISVDDRRAKRVLSKLLLHFIRNYKSCVNIKAVGSRYRVNCKRKFASAVSAYERKTLAMESEIRCKSNSNDYLPERVVIIYRSTASNLQTQRGVPIRDATMVPLSCWKTRYRVTGENRIARESSRCGGSAPLRRSRAIDATSIQTQYREQRDRRRIQPHCCWHLSTPATSLCHAYLSCLAESNYDHVRNRCSINYRFKNCCPTNYRPRNCYFVNRWPANYRLNDRFVANQFFQKIIFGFYFVQKTNILRWGMVYAISIQWTRYVRASINRHHRSPHSINTEE